MESIASRKVLKQRILGSSQKQDVQDTPNTSVIHEHDDTIQLNADTMNRNFNSSTNEQIDTISSPSLDTSPTRIQSIRESFNASLVPGNREHKLDISDTPSKRKSVNLDLLENNQGFSISDFNDNISGSNSEPSKPNSLKGYGISRSHWKHPSSASSCSYPKCEKSLNIKNGAVNCRKCGSLYCNEHTHYKVRLINYFPEPAYNATKQGTWSRCCKNCFFLKPDLVEGTNPLFNDITTKFKKKRSLYVEKKLLSKDMIQKKFIKLVNFSIEKYFKQKSGSIMWSFIGNGNLSNTEFEKGLVGLENWEDDKNTTLCSICLVRFNFLIRKHHCRLCGRIVCDDYYGERKQCSIVVPLNKVLQKAPHLNYSPLVKKNIQDLFNTEIVNFRCCLNCKNDLLYDWKLENVKKPSETELRIYSVYEQILAIKIQISTLIPKYSKVIESEDVELINKMRNKLMGFLKEFENSISQFKARFFLNNDQTSAVFPEFYEYSKVLNNIYSSIIIYLQDNLLTYKSLNMKFKEREQAKLQRKSRSTSPVVPPLTKKEIRELREQLMVMNEQKFLIENLIEDFTKMRKFDELNSLIENKNELVNTISQLESRLGEFGF